MKKLESALNNLSIDNLLDHLNLLNDETWHEVNLPYIKVYNFLLDFTSRNRNAQDLTTLIGLSHLVYGWMPTILDNIDLKEEYSEEVWVNISNGSLDPKFLEQICKLTNNSIIGASKLLHFLNPEQYAIWDSRVFRNIKFLVHKEKHSGYHSQVNQINNYIVYINKLNDLSLDKKFPDLVNLLSEKKVIDDKTSKLRILELSLFLNDSSKVNDNSM